MVPSRPTPLSDAAILLRGGLSMANTLGMNAQTTFDATDQWAVSAFAATDRTLEEIARDAHAQGRLNHSKVTVSTVGAFRQSGFRVEPTPDDYPHVDIFLMAHGPSQVTWEAMAALFQAPVPNPALSNQGETD
jgi:hypothetical protein